jgi:ribose transport system ATP-binding protein
MALAVEMKCITKHFPGVKALSNIDLEIEEGEIHALVGENGAGKSTLIKILSGAYAADSGEIVIFGKPMNNASPSRMIKEGVSVIYQELMLAENMSVAENVFLGKYPKTHVGSISKTRMIQETREICSRLNLNLNPQAVVGKMSVAGKQMVEITKAVSRNARVLVLDEPTAVLGENDLEGLFTLIRHLRKQGVAIIYISHRLKEIFSIADRVTILKDGEKVCTEFVRDIDEDRMVRCMVGRKVTDIYPKEARTPGEVVLEVDDLSVGFVQGVSFHVRKGEIFSLSGLAGSGRTEIIRAIAGADPREQGSIRYKGQKTDFRSPKSSLRRGIGLLPEERKTQGLFIQQNIRYNFSISKYSNYIQRLLISLKRERTGCRQYIKNLNIKPENMDFILKNMSGGNQQKVVLSKLLNADCQVLLIDEPTRGVDVGAKQEIYRLLNTLAREGVAIVMVSSELPEVLGMSDRIGVMNEGKMVIILDRKDAGEETIMKYATTC